jgi:hypothetical protein
MSIPSTLSGGLGTSLLGTSDPVRFTDPYRFDVDSPPSLFGRNVHGSTIVGESRTTLRYTLLIIIVSAILFVTIVSTFDVLRNGINYYYSQNIVKDPTLTARTKDILITSGFFSLFCWIIMFIFVHSFFNIVRQHAVQTKKLIELNKI